MIVSGKAGERYPWRPITIAQQLEQTAAEHGERLAVVEGDARYTWTDIRERARRHGRALIASGIERGDHVAVWLPNQVEWIIAWMGATYAGAVQIPINSRYKQDEVRYILRQSDSRMLVMRDRFVGLEYAEMLATMREHDDLPMLDTVVAIGDPPPDTVPYDEFLARAEPVSDAKLDERAATVELEDPTIVVYTSGTTGHPKGAVHSHMILRNECTITERLEIEPDSRILGHMPFFHVAGGLSAVLPALIAGAGLVIMDHWDIDDALELIEREGITCFGGIPTHFIDVLNHPTLGQRDVSTLQSGWIGGASNPPEVIHGAIDTLGITRLLPVYGMTETTSVTTFPAVDDPREIILAGKGLPIADFELRIVDVESNAELDAGAEGEICVRGHIVMQGYYRNPEATAAVMDDDGWFHTGDLGVLDPSGHLSITGRKSDMFIVGGANAYPAEIELALAEHEDVVQAYVVGAPHPRLGEVGFAFVQRRDESLDETELRAFAKARLADFKVPRHVRFVDEFPVTATGKIQRFKLREMATELAAQA